MRVRVKLDEHRIEELLRGSEGSGATSAAARVLSCLGDMGQVSFMPHNGGESCGHRARAGPDCLSAECRWSAVSLSSLNKVPARFAPERQRVAAVCCTSAGQTPM